VCTQKTAVTHAQSDIRKCVHTTRGVCRSRNQLSSTLKHGSARTKCDQIADCNSASFPVWQSFYKNSAHPKCCESLRERLYVHVKIYGVHSECQAAEQQETIFTEVVHHTRHKHQSTRTSRAVDTKGERAYIPTRTTHSCASLYSSRDVHALQLIDQDVRTADEKSLNHQRSMKSVKARPVVVDGSRTVVVFVILGRRASPTAYGRT